MLQNTYIPNCILFFILHPHLSLTIPILPPPNHMAASPVHWSLFLAQVPESEERRVVGRRIDGAREGCIEARHHLHILHLHLCQWEKRKVC